MNPEPAVGGGALAWQASSRPGAGAAARPAQDNQTGHIKPRKTRTLFLQFCRYPRSSARRGAVRYHLRQPQPHLTTRKGKRASQ